ncbi:MAG TPA: hypothetical protein VM347_00230 [Nonomuraea sp.]|nr:hypothetical protein [Nonomuraea sp.]
MLFAFNGATCELFAEMEPAAVAGSIRDRLFAHGHRMSLLTLIVTNPLWMLDYAHSISQDYGAEAEETLRDAEMAAALTAVPTPGASEVLRACTDSGRRVAMVGDTCSGAIESYLDAHGLRHLVGPVIGREQRQPATQEPGVDLLRQAVMALDAERSDCTLISVSSDEMFVAADAGVQAIGVVSEYGNRKHLAGVGGSVAVSSMRQLAGALTAVSITNASETSPQQL